VEKTAERETGRLEAFSDGVFAIAITLLVLDLKVPRADSLPPGGGGLLRALAKQWPAFLAYLTSFATILVMWVNHHILFTHIRRTSQPFLYWNGLLLLFVTFVPFPTSLVAAYVLTPQARTAAAVYAGTFLVLALVFNGLWRHASTGRRLLDPAARAASVQAITRQYLVGPVAYFAAFLLAFVWVPGSVGLCLVLALFFAFTGALPRLFERKRSESS